MAETGMKPIDWRLRVHHDVDPVPKEWATLRNHVSVDHPGAVIAGGCLRDLILGAPVKDIDFFVPATDRPANMKWAGWEKVREFTDTQGYILGFRDEVCRVTEFFVPYQPLLPVQIIELRWDLSQKPFIDFVMERMDFDFCRVAYGPRRPMLDRAKLEVSLEAQCAFETNVATLMICEDRIQAERSIKRAIRFQEKYPGWMFDLTLANQHLT